MIYGTRYGSDRPTEKWNGIQKWMNEMTEQSNLVENISNEYGNGFGFGERNDVYG